MLFASWLSAVAIVTVWSSLSQFTAHACIHEMCFACCTCEACDYSAVSVELGSGRFLWAEANLTSLSCIISIVYFASNTGCVAWGQTRSTFLNLSWKTRNMLHGCKALCLSGKGCTTFCLTETIMLAEDCVTFCLTETILLAEDCVNNHTFIRLCNFLFETILLAEICVNNHAFSKLCNFLFETFILVAGCVTFCVTETIMLYIWLKQSCF